jgi:hypothetical protein
VNAARGADPALDRESAALALALDDARTPSSARAHLVERMTLLLQASILRRGGHDAVCHGVSAPRGSAASTARRSGTLSPGRRSTC